MGHAKGQVKVTQISIANVINDDRYDKHQFVIMQKVMDGLLISRSTFDLGSLYRSS